MSNFKCDNKVFLFFAALIAGLAFYFLGDSGGNVFEQIIYYVGYIAVLLFGLALIFYGLFGFFNKH